MKANSIDFIYQAMNAIASRRHNPDIEQQLSEAIEEEILAIKASLVLARWPETTLPTVRAEAHVA